MNWRSIWQGPMPRSAAGLFLALVSAAFLGLVAFQVVTGR